MRGYTITSHKGALPPWPHDPKGVLLHVRLCAVSGSGFLHLVRNPFASRYPKANGEFFIPVIVKRKGAAIGEMRRTFKVPGMAAFRTVFIFFKAVGLFVAPSRHSGLLHRSEQKPVVQCSSGSSPEMRFTTSTTQYTV